MVELLIEVQCECGTFTSVKYDERNKIFTGMCPNHDCQIWNNLRIKNITPDHYQSDNNDVKDCPICDKRWVKSHTCKASLTKKLSCELLQMTNGVTI